MRTFIFVSLVVLFSVKTWACDFAQNLQGVWSLKQGHVLFEEVGEAPVASALETLKIEVTKSSDGVYKISQCRAIDTNSVPTQCGAGSFKIEDQKVIAVDAAGKALAIIGQCNARELFFRTQGSFLWPDSPVAGGDVTWILRAHVEGVIFEFITSDFWGSLNLQALMGRSE